MTRGTTLVEPTDDQVAACASVGYAALGVHQELTGNFRRQTPWDELSSASRAEYVVGARSALDGTLGPGWMRDDVARRVFELVVRAIRRDELLRRLSSVAWGVMPTARLEEVWSVVSREAQLDEQTEPGDPS